MCQIFCDSKPNKTGTVKSEKPMQEWNLSKPTPRWSKSIIISACDPVMSVSVHFKPLLSTLAQTLTMFRQIWLMQVLLSFHLFHYCKTCLYQTIQNKKPIYSKPYKTRNLSIPNHVKQETCLNWTSFESFYANFNAF